MTVRSYEYLCYTLLPNCIWQSLIWEVLWSAAAQSVDPRQSFTRMSPQSVATALKKIAYVFLSGRWVGICVWQHNLSFSYVSIVIKLWCRGIGSITSPKLLAVRFEQRRAPSHALELCSEILISFLDVSSESRVAVGWCSVSMYTNAERCSALLSESIEMAATLTSHFVRTNPILLRGDRAAGRCESLSPSLVPENFPESLMLHYAERRCLLLESRVSGSFFPLIKKVEFSSSAITKRKQRFNWRCFKGRKNAPLFNFSVSEDVHAHMLTQRSRGAERSQSQKSKTPPVL